MEREAEASTADTTTGHYARDPRRAQSGQSLVDPPHELAWKKKNVEEENQAYLLAQLASLALQSPTQTRKNLRTMWDGRKPAPVSPKLTRAKIPVKIDSLVACASNFQPPCALRQYSHGELHTFRLKAEEILMQKWKLQRWAWSFEHWWPKPITNHEISTDCTQTFKGRAIAINRGLINYHTSAHMQKKLTDMPHRGYTRGI